MLVGQGPMYTTFVKRSIGPVLLVLAGTGVAEFSFVFFLAGGIWEAFNVARLIERR